MTVKDHLTRLAFGRSPFEPLSPAQQAQFSAASTTATATSAEPQTQRRYVQQYDASGAPMNPSSAARKQAMRRAQNEVLALVGVCERKGEVKEGEAKESGGRGGG
ncbi:hypothetical protein LTR66_003820 [Elasticomyces elasticus]|nr:hypothetical protein LTR50_004963 [Elasticomyces elasticus]KAK4996592.1 hypothetical protein LTR66_003820 [Elasticomyces elasticus]